MNCYYHPENSAVAQCGKCGKFLCRHCVVEGETILCQECKNFLMANEQQAWQIEREQQKENILISGVIFMLLVVGSFLVSGTVHILESFIWGLYFAGLPYGWRKLSNTKLNCILILPFLGWILYITIKLQVSCWIGWFLFIKDVVQYLQQNKK